MVDYMRYVFGMVLIYKEVLFFAGLVCADCRVRRFPGIVLDHCRSLLSGYIHSWGGNHFHFNGFGRRRVMFRDYVLVVAIHVVGLVGYVLS